MICFLLFVCAVLGFYYFLIKPQVHWFFRNVKQGFPIPFFGDNLLNIFLLISTADLQRKLYSQFPNERYRGIYQSLVPTLMIRDPKILKLIGIKDFHHFVDHRDFTPPKVDPIWDRTLFCLKGQEWQNMRFILSPSFTSIKMKAMLSFMNQSSEKYIKYLMDQENSVLEMEGKSFFSRYTVDVIANCAFGIEIDSIRDKDNQFFNMAVNAGSLTSNGHKLKRFINFLYPTILEISNISLFNSKIINFFEELVSASVEYREKKHIVRPDVIHLLMEAAKGRLKYEEDTAHSQSTGYATVEESDIGKVQNSKGISKLANSDMTAQVLIFLLAGFDTISSSLGFTVLELAQNPSIQERLRQEIDEHYEETNGVLTYDLLPKLKYLDMVITESLRMYPPFILTDRVCTKPYVIEPISPNEKPLQINVDDVILVPIIGIHYDPKYYPEPNKFDPERFSDQNKHNVDPYTFLPFGLGPRNCIGSRFALMELKTILFHLLAKFEIIVTEKTPIPIKFSKRATHLFMEEGFWVGLRKRTDAKM